MKRGPRGRKNDPYNYSVAAVRRAVQNCALNPPDSIDMETDP